jgi:DHA1 family bicyclomycin/chloramphenicol resistance-like MFS transporter
MLVGAVAFSTPKLLAVVCFFVLMSARGLIGPIAGLGGATTAVPMAVLMIAGAAASMAGLVILARPTNTLASDAELAKATGRGSAGVRARRR